MIRVNPGRYSTWCQKWASVRLQPPSSFNFIYGGYGGREGSQGEFNKPGCDDVVSRSPDHAFHSLFIMLTSSCRGDDEPGQDYEPGRVVA